MDFEHVNTMANQRCLRICSTALKMLVGSAGIVTFFYVSTNWFRSWYFWQHSIKIFIGLFVLNFTIVATKKQKNNPIQTKQIYTLLFDVHFHSILPLVAWNLITPFCSSLNFFSTLLECKGETQRYRLNKFALMYIFNVSFLCWSLAIRLK